MIIPGKIPYVKKAALDISLSAGTMIDYQTWISADQHRNYFQNSYTIPYDNLSVKIFLDDKMLLESSFESSVNLSYSFLDCTEVLDHCLKIEYCGFQEEFCCHVGGVGDVSPMIKIDSLCIEHLNMNRVLEDIGGCIHFGTTESFVPSVLMGCNGIQTLSFTTPIYHWLLKHHRSQNYYSS